MYAKTKRKTQTVSYGPVGRMSSGQKNTVKSKRLLGYAKETTKGFIVPDEEIMEMNEYKAYMSAPAWKSMGVKPEEAMEACRDMLAKMRSSKSVNWKKEARGFVLEAREKLSGGVEIKEKAEDTKKTDSNKQAYYELTNMVGNIIPDDYTYSGEKDKRKSAELLSNIILGIDTDPKEIGSFTEEMRADLLWLREVTTRPLIIQTVIKGLEAYDSKNSYADYYKIIKRTYRLINLDYDVHMNSDLKKDKLKSGKEWEVEKKNKTFGMLSQLYSLKGFDIPKKEGDETDAKYMRRMVMNFQVELLKEKAKDIPGAFFGGYERFTEFDKFLLVPAYAIATNLFFDEIYKWACKMKTAVKVSISGGKFSIDYSIDPLLKDKNWTSGKFLPGWLEWLKLSAGHEGPLKNEVIKLHEFLSYINDIGTGKDVFKYKYPNKEDQIKTGYELGAGFDFGKVIFDFLYKNTDFDNRDYGKFGQFFKGNKEEDKKRGKENFYLGDKQKSTKKYTAKLQYKDGSLNIVIEAGKEKNITLDDSTIDTESLKISGSKELSNIILGLELGGEYTNKKTNEKESSGGAISGLVTLSNKKIDAYAGAIYKREGNTSTLGFVGGVGVQITPEMKFAVAGSYSKSDKNHNSVNFGITYTTDSLFGTKETLEPSDKEKYESRRDYKSIEHETGEKEIAADKEEILKSEATGTEATPVIPDKDLLKKVKETSKRLIVDSRGQWVRVPENISHYDELNEEYTYIIEKNMKIYFLRKEISETGFIIPPE
ncbi:MAG: hypothetical protein GY760_09295 [Deltaproteobacteria bacterium]|nr:hypothetical protein [Deltaproteobacteria bacterium]